MGTCCLNRKEQLKMESNNPSNNATNNNKDAIVM
jgi:hypothetical protein